MLSGVGSGGSGFFIDGVEIPPPEWDELQEFDAYGRPIPISPNKAAIEANPKFMTAPEGWSDDIDPVEVEQDIYDQVLEEAELKKAEEIAAAGKAYWDAVMQGAIDFLSGDGMLKADEQNKQPDDKLISLSEQQAETNKAQADTNLALANAQTSKNVVKDLEKESVKKDTGGRRKPAKIENLRGEKAGWEMAEGSNFWSVNEKDPYWQTKEGYKEAMNLYGTKPGWVKEPSLEYNPKTGEYDPIAKEEFAEIKPTKRISL